MTLQEAKERYTVATTNATRTTTTTGTTTTTTIRTTNYNNEARKRIRLADLRISLMICILYAISTIFSSSTSTLTSSSYSSCESNNNENYNTNHGDSSFFRNLGTSSSSSSEPSDKKNDFLIPLHVLTDSQNTPLLELVCRSMNLTLYPDRIVNESTKTTTTTSSTIIQQQQQQQKIPKIIHFTSKSRCMTTNFIENMNQWKDLFQDYSIYFHDDAAVERLLSLSSSSSQYSSFRSSFPHLSLATKCVRSGAAMADLWRYLILWEYGGIYTDIDNAPGILLWKHYNNNNNNETSNSSSSSSSIFISPDDDAYFVVESLGVLSQYFMAASPKHPLLYFAIQTTLQRLLAVDHLGKQYIPQVTGPGALKAAFKYFMRAPPPGIGAKEKKGDKDDQDQDEDEDGEDEKGDTRRKLQSLHQQYGRVKQGKYWGIGNRSVTVAGSKVSSWQIINRGSVKGKTTSYKQMNMQHFSGIAKKKFNESCLAHLYNSEYMGIDLTQLSNW